MEGIQPIGTQQLEVVMYILVCIGILLRTDRMRRRVNPGKENTHTSGFINDYFYEKKSFLKLLSYSCAHIYNYSCVIKRQKLYGSPR